jgi:chemotaxis methyl-accepting protein methylase
MANDQSPTIFARCATSRLGRRCLSAYQWHSRRIWNHLPASLRQLSGRAYGSHLHALARFQAERKQYFATFFLRNRPELELMRRLVDQKIHGSPIKVTVLACSKGAEVYSIVWALRSARPDLQFRIRAVDISQEIVDFAERGMYSLTNGDDLSRPHLEDTANNNDVNRNTQRDQNAWIFERVSAEEMEALFEIEGDQVQVRPWLKEGIVWSCGDAGDPDLVGVLGPQDIVVANRFLCHMKPKAAEQCLRNIAKIVNPGGYLFVSGIDLDVRTKVARELGWNPVKDLLREVYEGDSSLRQGWPLEYWGSEPFSDARSDWQIRYASVFQIGEAATSRVSR